LLNDGKFVVKREKEEGDKEDFETGKPVDCSCYVEKYDNLNKTYYYHMG
jgi:hypothetical protein